MPRKRKKQIFPGPVLDRIPFWTWVIKVVGINGPGHKVQLTPEQRAIWKSVDRKIALDPEEAAGYQRLTGLEPWEPDTPVPPFTLLALSRGAGKTMFVGCLAMYEALTSPYEAMPGEDVGVIVIAPRVMQSKRIIGYAEGLVKLPLISPFIESSIGSEIRIKGGRRIVVAAADQEGTAARGMTALMLVIDEAAFLSPNEDEEIFEAASSSGRGVSTFRAILCSSVNGKSGLFWDQYEPHYGVESELWSVFDGPAHVVYPAVLSDPDAIRKKVENPRAFRREYCNDWDAGCDAAPVFDPDQILRAVSSGVVQIDEMSSRLQYIASVDVSSMVDDRFVLTVLGRDAELGRVQQCLLKIWDPAVEKTSVRSIAEQVAKLIHPYGLESVVGDSYAKTWVGETFLEAGVSYDAYTTNRPQKLSRASLINDLLESGSIALLDNALQAKELKEYQKTTLPSGAVVVNKPPTKTGSDDTVDALGLGLERLIGQSAALHPPEGLADVDSKKRLKLFAGERYPRAVGVGPIVPFADITARGEGPAWVVANWNRDWRFAQCSVGELAWLCGIGPYPMANHLGRDTVLQLTWMRWVLAHWVAYKGEGEWISGLPIYFPAIPAWDEIKRQFLSDVERSVTHSIPITASMVFVRGRFRELIPSWVASAPAGISERSGVSRSPAEKPWAPPLESWGLGELVDNFSAPPWAPEIEQVFARGRLERRQKRYRGLEVPETQNGAQALVRRW